MIETNKKHKGAHRELQVVGLKLCKLLNAACSEWDVPNINNNCTWQN